MTHQIEGCEAHWRPEHRMFAATVSIYPARRITLADIAKVTARAIITLAGLGVAIAPAIILTAMEHTR